jgi:hypothetical protein
MEALRPSSDAADAITPTICPLSEKVGNHISRYGMIATRLLKLISAAAERAVRVDCTGLLVCAFREYPNIPLLVGQECWSMSFPFSGRR